jgi:hypothetical protein
MRLADPAGGASVGCELGTASIWNFFAEMLELYPDRANPGSLWASARSRSEEALPIPACATPRIVRLPPPLPFPSYC